jgi:hypothetical protein
MAVHTKLKTIYSTTNTYNLHCCQWYKYTIKALLWNTKHFYVTGYWQWHVTLQQQQQQQHTHTHTHTQCIVFILKNCYENGPQCYMYTAYLVETNYIAPNLHSYHTLQVNAALKHKKVRLLMAFFRRKIWLIDRNARWIVGAVSQSS